MGMHFSPLRRPNGNFCRTAGATFLSTIINDTTGEVKQDVEVQGAGGTRHFFAALTILS